MRNFKQSMVGIAHLTALTAQAFRPVPHKIHESPHLLRGDQTGTASANSVKNLNALTI